MTLGEKYYNIAMDDINYLNAVKIEGFYNQTTSLCQQAAEKLLKSIVADYYTETDLEDVLRSHSLKRIAVAAERIIEEDRFDKKALAYLSDFYFDARYPGPDYIKVDKKTYEECYQIMDACRIEADKVLFKLKNNSGYVEH